MGSRKGGEFRNASAAGAEKDGLTTMDCVTSVADACRRTGEHLAGLEHPVNYEMTCPTHEVESNVLVTSEATRSEDCIYLSNNRFSKRKPSISELSSSIYLIDSIRSRLFPLVVSASPDKLRSAARTS